jgi:hypothetical protein
MPVPALQTGQQDDKVRARGAWSVPGLAGFTPKLRVNP